MNISRRQFWKLAASGVVGAVVTANVDLEKLLWVPGEKTYFLPSASGANTLITPEWMAKEVLKVLKRNLRFVNGFNSSYYGDEPMKIGNTVNIRMPQRFTVNRRFVPQSITDNTKAITLTDQHSVSMETTLQNATWPIERARAEAKAIGKQLAHRLNEQKLDVFGVLALPAYAEAAVNVIDRDTGIALRSIKAYDINTDTYIQRFDVLGGSSGQKG